MAQLSGMVSVSQLTTWSLCQPTTCLTASPSGWWRAMASAAKSKCSAFWWRSRASTTSLRFGQRVVKERMPKGRCVRLILNIAKFASPSDWPIMRAVCCVCSADSYSFAHILFQPCASVTTQRALSDRASNCAIERSIERASDRAIGRATQRSGVRASVHHHHHHPLCYIWLTLVIMLH